MFVRYAQSDEAVVAALDRHDQRRQRGVPTISVLVGSVIPSLRFLSHWAETGNRRLVSVRLEEADPEAVVVPWVGELANKHDLGTAAVHWLAQRLSRDAQALERSFRLMTLHELGSFLESYLPLEGGTSVALVGRRLIESTATGTKPGGPDLARDLNMLLEGHGRPWIRIFRAMGELLDWNRLPVLIVSLAKPSVTGLEGIARLLAELATGQPRGATALIVSQDLFDSFVAVAPASRAKALLLESIMTLNGKQSSVTAEPVLPSIVAPESTCDDLIVDDLESRIRDLGASQQSSDDDEARSAAERFLFERLESGAETAGSFELNATLDFYFGSSRWIEVDFAARSLKLAIEVDGYHHFHDPEAFRRDRRKDLELQKHGYLVVRVLAEDVVERPEEVMDTILEAVAFRRAAATHLGATP
jgi:Protein of unknown function (DUF559)